MSATDGTTTTTRVFSQKSRFIFVPRFAEDETSSRRAHAAFAYVRRSRVIIRGGLYLLYFCGFARRRKVVVVYYVRVISSIIRLGLSFVRRVRLVR